MANKEPTPNVPITQNYLDLIGCPAITANLINYDLQLGKSTLVITYNLSLDSAREFYTLMGSGKAELCIYRMDSQSKPVYVEKIVATVKNTYDLGNKNQIEFNIENLSFEEIKKEEPKGETKETGSSENTRDKDNEKTKTKESGTGKKKTVKKGKQSGPKKPTNPPKAK